jgi:hypothetical protein
MTVTASARSAGWLNSTIVSSTPTVRATGVAAPAGPVSWASIVNGAAPRTTISCSGLSGVRKKSTLRPPSVARPRSWRSAVASTKPSAKRTVRRAASVCGSTTIWVSGSGVHAGSPAGAAPSASGSSIALTLSRHSSLPAANRTLD